MFRACTGRSYCGRFAPLQVSIYSTYTYMKYNVLHCVYVLHQVSSRLRALFPLSMGEFLISKQCTLGRLWNRTASTLNAKSETRMESTLPPSSTGPRLWPLRTCECICVCSWFQCLSERKTESPTHPHHLRADAPSAIAMLHAVHDGQNLDKLAVT